MEQSSPILEFFDDEPIITPAVMRGGVKVKLPVTIKTALCTFLCENIDSENLAPILSDCRLLFYVYGRSGKVPVFQYKEDCLIVLMTVGSPVAVAVVEELKNLGISVIMISGDNIRTANALANKVGISKVYAEVLPNGKAEIVRNLKQNDVVAMVRKYSAADRIAFMHIRNILIMEDGSFEESGHLSKCGSLDMYEVTKALVETGFDGYVRPDHGRMIWGETGKPGYGLYDRALGAAYINGLFEACEKACK